jgi:hypothetical protein
MLIMFRVDLYLINKNHCTNGTSTACTGTFQWKNYLQSFSPFYFRALVAILKFH